MEAIRFRGSLSTGVASEAERRRRVKADYRVSRTLRAEPPGLGKAAKMARVPFDTVATFNDKKNNNNVSVNIALQPLKKQQPQPPQPHVPQPPHLRVDKSTLTDPETESSGEKTSKQKSRLHSVLDSLKSVFQWTTHSISGGMRNSESFIVENGELNRRPLLTTSLISRNLFSPKGGESILSEMGSLEIGLANRKDL